jgi:hypothetical protein
LKAFYLDFGVRRLTVTVRVKVDAVFGFQTEDALLEGHQQLLLTFLLDVFAPQSFVADHLMGLVRSGHLGDKSGSSSIGLG